MENDTRMRDIRDSIIQSLGGDAADYDVDKILADYLARWGRVPLDELDADREHVVDHAAYWGIVAEAHRGL